MGGANSRVDFESLELIENAIRYYESSHILRLPGTLPEEADKDYRYIDYVLMEETFMSCGILVFSLTRFAGRGALQKETA